MRSRPSRPMRIAPASSWRSRAGRLALAGYRGAAHVASSKPRRRRAARPLGAQCAARAGRARARRRLDHGARRGAAVLRGRGSATAQTRAGGASGGWPAGRAAGRHPEARARARAYARRMWTRLVDRNGLWRAATPQVFRLGMLLRALEAALDAQRIPTDEAQAIEWAGQRPLLVAGRADNIKVTTAEDLEARSRHPVDARRGRIPDAHWFGFRRPCLRAR